MAVYNLDDTDNTQVGTTAADVFTGGGGSDSLSGGLGNDTFNEAIAGNGSDTLDGGGGVDTVTYRGTATDAPITYSVNYNESYNIVTRGSDTDQLIGIEQVVATTSLDDMFVYYGASGADQEGAGFSLNLTTGVVKGITGITAATMFENANGSDRADTIVGSAGNNVINGLGGNDTIGMGTGGKDTLNGGSGTDTLLLAENMTFNISNNQAFMNKAPSIITETSGFETVTASASTTDKLFLTSLQYKTLNMLTGAYQDADATLGTFKGFENLEVTSSVAFCTWTGNNAANQVTIQGVIHSTTLDAGLGNDTIQANHLDHSTILGNVGVDTVKIPQLNYGHIDGGAGNDTVYLTHANYSTVTGGLGVDTILGTNTTVTVGMAFSTFNMDAGNDVVTVDDMNFSTINGGDGNDTITVDNAVVHSTVSGGAGNDTVYLAKNLVFSNVSGGAGMDRLFVQQGTGNIIFTYNSESGNTVTATSGIHQFSVVTQFEAVVATTATGDILNLSDDTDGVTVNMETGGVVNAGVNGLTQALGFEHLVASQGNDIILGSAASNNINGYGGNDTIYYTTGADTLNGSGGTDSVVFGSAPSGIRVNFNGSDSGASVIIGKTTQIINEFESITGSKLLTDILDASKFTTNISINLNTGETTNLSTYTSLKGFENFYGGSGNDMITGTTAVNVLRGGDGNDTINAGAGNDIIEGNGGDDLLYGGLGNDVYYMYNTTTEGSTVSYDTNIGFDIIQDSSGTISGGTMDIAIFKVALANATFHLVDSNDADNFYDALRIDFGSSTSVIIGDYFNNTTTTLSQLKAGIGCIERLDFTTDRNVDFAQVLTLVSEPLSLV